MGFRGRDWQSEKDFRVFHRSLWKREGGVKRGKLSSLRVTLPGHYRVTFHRHPGEFMYVMPFQEPLLFAAIAAELGYSEERSKEVLALPGMTIHLSTLCVELERG
jgi:hypothetical protein